MNWQAVLFDVDGTIINGNCTQIFIQYLFEEEIIDQADFIQYTLLIKSYSPANGNYSHIAKEAFKLLSTLESVDLLSNWERCFNTRVIDKLNKKILSEIERYQSNGTDIFLASGSPKILIEKVADYLHIKHENIIASDVASKNNIENNTDSFQLCIGKGKKDAVIDLFNQLGIKIHDACFYSDNLSDLELLAESGEGQWLGSSINFTNYSMDTLGINFFLRDLSPIKNEVVQNVDSDKLLNSYYQEKKSTIEKAISVLLPIDCTEKTMFKLVGKHFKHWDLNTLQKTFFNPIYEYLGKYNLRIVSLGPCIFMEGGGLPLEKYIPIIAIGELLYLSNEVFKDITDWASGNAKNICGKSHLEISILGNASISLLTLPAHSLIFEYIPLSQEKKLRLFEIYTTIVFHSLFGNGIKLYWEQQNTNTINYQEYFQVAGLLNQGILQLASGLYLVFSDNITNFQIKKMFDEFSSEAGKLIQLEKDLLSYDNWLNTDYLHMKNDFNLKSNFMCVHACQSSGDSSLFSIKESQSDIVDKLVTTGAVDKIKIEIAEYREKVGMFIHDFPFENTYKQLIHSYLNQLVHV